MKEMVYQDTRLKTPILLGSGNIGDYQYIILSHGTHPCAYISIPKSHKYYKKKYKKLPHSNDVSVHGGITFAEKMLLVGKTENDDTVWLKGHWIGWDYAHCGDYIGHNFFFDMYSIFNEESKKWTTAEILEDVKSVIKQLEAMK